MAEIVNIGVGRAAGILNEMVDGSVDLKVPSIEVLLSRKALREGKLFGGQMLSCVKMPFNGSLTGCAYLIFRSDSALNLVAALTGERVDSPDLDSMKVETLNEVGNIIINAVMGSIGNILDKYIDYSVPAYEESTFSGILSSNVDDDAWVVLAHTDFSIEKRKIKGNILLVFELASFDSVLSAIDSMS